MIKTPDQLLVGDPFSAFRWDMIKLNHIQHMGFHGMVSVRYGRVYFSALRNKSQLHLEKQTRGDCNAADSAWPLINGK